MLPKFPTDVTRPNLWDKRCDQVMKRQIEYEKNKNSLFQLIWGQCSQGLKDEIKALPHYNDMKTRRNCIELLSDLNTIIHRFETIAHPQVAMHTAKKAYYNCHQYQGESNSDYFNRFNFTIDVVTKDQGRLGDDEYLVEDTLIASGDYTSSIATRKFTYRVWKDDILVSSFPRRILLKIARTPRTELYKSVITKGYDHTFV